jgi:hypothetical protein
LSAKREARIIRSRASYVVRRDHERLSALRTLAGRMPALRYQA